MNRQIAQRLFLFGWPTVVIVAGSIGFRGLDAIGVGLLVFAAAVVIPASIVQVLNDRADRENEKRIGLPDVQRAVMEKGRTATWGVMISSTLLAVLVWYLLRSYDVRSIVW